MTDPDAVAREKVVAAPPGEVFRWFVDPDLLARWIGIRAAVVFTWGWESGAIPGPAAPMLTSASRSRAPARSRSRSPSRMRAASGSGAWSPPWDGAEPPAAGVG